MVGKHPMMPVLTAQYSVSLQCPLCEWVMYELDRPRERPGVKCVNGSCRGYNVVYTYHRPGVILERV